MLQLLLEAAQLLGCCCRGLPRLLLLLSQLLLQLLHSPLQLQVVAGCLPWLCQCVLLVQLLQLLC
jgi:hypothetical protein